MNPIVEVKDLWKEYRRGAQKEKYLSLRDHLFRSLKPGGKKETFWALQDINFEVYPGDSLAIIGKNGAGKSTLLKILSKITPPTKGEITLRGRLASLLEVGTGFHPELTGRENIYLNGSILGLTRQEINRQFDAIVDFSGVESFLETPLKHYSSGMQLRLAFAVAAHLEPEILVIDEVLTVGDAEFQKKCFGKMSEVSQSGRTILFVSHNITAIRSLCPRAILLSAGQLIVDHHTDAVISDYYKLSTESGAFVAKPRNGLYISNVLLNDSQNNYTVGLGHPIILKLLIENPLNQAGQLEIAGAIKDNEGNYLLYFGSHLTGTKFDVNIDDNKLWILLKTGRIVLRPNTYYMTLELKLNDEIIYKEEDCLSFIVDETDFFGTGRKWHSKSLTVIEQVWSKISN